jgi:hypothetical protein
MTVIPVLRRKRQKDLMLEVSLVYITNSRPAWAVYQHPISKKK